MMQSGDGSAQAFAEAYTAIQNLYARYNWCSDAGDADGYAACFTESGELSLPGVGLHIRGRENLRDFKRQGQGAARGPDPPPLEQRPLARGRRRAHDARAVLSPRL